MRLAYFADAADRYFRTARAFSRIPGGRNPGRRYPPGPVRLCLVFRRNTRNVIVQKNTKASLAANAAGYEDPARFGREFRRCCGQNPAEMKREVTVA